MASTLLTFATWYLYIGAATAAVFLLYGLGQLDENARGAWVFRPLLIPGVLLIWPLVLWRWRVLHRGEDRLERHRMPRTGQGRMVALLVCAIPTILGVAMLVRQDPTDLPPPVLLEAPE